MTNNINIEVSIICNVFNHEKYIEDAIKSFLSQKTDFKFEICIHDDASSDRTPEIIAKYQNLYPDLIKVIHQIENQYSKGNLVSLLNLEQASGKFLAFCEGDDYWIDDIKLQKQYNIIKSNKNISMVSHSYLIKNVNKTSRFRKVEFNALSSFVKDELILKSFNPVFHLNTLLIRRNVLDFPDFFKEAGSLDSVLLHHAILKGRVYYISEYMSVYRTGVTNSWTSRLLENRAQLNKSYLLKEEFLRKYDVFTSFKYHHLIEKHLHKISIYLDTSKKNWNVSKFKVLMQTFGLKNAFKIMLENMFPKSVYFFRKIYIKYIY